MQELLGEPIWRGAGGIPLVSIGLNLLSVGAGYGLITLIFQDGRLQGPLGYTSFGGIVSWVPLSMLVLLFGLSMDYHVFLLSRIRDHVAICSTRPGSALAAGARKLRPMSGRRRSGGREHVGECLGPPGEPLGRHGRQMRA